MEEAQNNDRVTTGRFFTSARRFKQVLGSLPDGTKIPGGPYTYTQIGVMLGTLATAWITRGVWGSGSAIGDLITSVALAVGVGFLIAKLPGSRRSPLRLLGSSVGLLTHPGPGGRYEGRPLKLSRTAQKIQREQKNAAKSAAKTKKKGTDASGESISDQPQRTSTLPAGQGTSLDRLLAKHGLLEDERNN